jgi:hypothetical protein
VYICSGGRRKCRDNGTVKFLFSKCEVCLIFKKLIYTEDHLIFKKHVYEN